MTDTAAQAPDLANRAVRGAATMLAGQAGRFVLQIASLVVLTRFLSRADYGLVAMVTAIVGVAALLSDFGLSTAAMRAPTLSDGQKSNLFWLNSAVGLAASLLALGLAHPIAAFYGRPELVAIVLAMSVTFLLSGLATQFRAELSRRLQFARVAAFDVTSQLMGFALALGAALAGAGYWALVIQQVTAAAVLVVLNFGFAGWRPGLPRRGVPMRQLTSFGATAFVIQVVTYASTNVDNVLIGRNFGAVALGLYSRAYLLFQLPIQQLTAPLANVALPVLAKLRDESSFVAYLHRAQLVLSYGLLGVFAVAASVAQPMFEILLGPQWVSAAPIFQVLAIGGIFQSMIVSIYWAFLSRNFVRLHLRFSVLGRAVVIALIFVGARHSPLAAAAAVSTGAAIMWVLYSQVAVPMTKIPLGRLHWPSWRAIGVYLVMAVVAQTGFRLGLDTQGLAVQLAGCLALDAAVLALAWLMLPSMRADLRVVVGSIRLMSGRSGPSSGEAKPVELVETAVLVESPDLVQSGDAALVNSGSPAISRDRQDDSAPARGPKHRLDTRAAVRRPTRPSPADERTGP